MGMVSFDIRSQFLILSQYETCVCTTIPRSEPHFGLLLQEQYIFIHQCVQLMWMKKKQQFCISDVIYENVSKSQFRIQSSKQTRPSWVLCLRTMEGDVMGHSRRQQSPAVLIPTPQMWLQGESNTVQTLELQCTLVGGYDTQELQQLIMI